MESLNSRLSTKWQQELEGRQEGHHQQESKLVELLKARHQAKEEKSLEVPKAKLLVLELEHNLTPTSQQPLR